MNKRYIVTTLLSSLVLQLVNVGLASHPALRVPIEDSATYLIQGNSATAADDQGGLFPMSPVAIVGLVIIVLIAGLANAGGIGGGTLLTSILIMFFYYTENTALTVVYSLVFGGSLGNFINVARRRDRKTGKPLIDFDLALVCMPPMILGTNIGVIAGRVAAPLVILVGIIVITIFTSTKIWKKAKKQYAQETTEIEHNEPMMNNPKGHSDVEWRERWMDSLQSSPDETSDPKLQKILKDEHKLFPPKKLAILIGLLLVIMLFSILRGTQQLKSPIGLSYCGAGYWGLFVLGLVICAIILVVNQRLVKAHIRIKREHDIDTHNGTFQVSSENIPKLTILSVIAGVLAGLLGIGGGMVMNPTLLSLGIPAQSLAATTGFFVVQTSFISLFQATLYGDVPLKEQAFFFVISLIGSFAVSYFLSWLVKKYNRPSLVLFALLIVLGMSLIATPAFEAWQYWGNVGGLLHFNPIC